jgi:S-adenosylmethionine-diacylglycerol 3-amino-3-carboxypropyl transferase
MTEAESWAQKVAAYPVAFSQVREDALGDLELVENQKGPLNILMVASGGCTAALLASNPKVRSLTLVDPNPAQIALARLKLELLANYDTDRRLQILGHRPWTGREECLGALLAELGLDSEIFGPFSELTELGPDQIGRYEQVFARIRDKMATESALLDDLFQLTDRALQVQSLARGTALGESLERAFESVFSLPNLIAIFGSGATSNRVQAFSDHFIERTRVAMGLFLAKSNPYLAQVFYGRFLGGALSPWLGLPRAPVSAHIDALEADMASALRNCKAASFDIVHLSNILDWLDSDSIKELLELSSRALRAGGLTVIRQLNSTVDILAADQSFVWDEEWGESLHKRDRSYFYRMIYVGRKK